MCSSEYTGRCNLLNISLEDILSLLVNRFITKYAKVGRSFFQMTKSKFRLLSDPISRSRYHRRRKDLVRSHRQVLRLLMDRLRTEADVLIIDSTPIITANPSRRKSARMPIWAPDAGYSPSIWLLWEALGEPLWDVKGGRSGMPFDGASRQTRRRRWPCGRHWEKGIELSTYPAPSATNSR